MQDLHETVALFVSSLPTCAPSKEEAFELVSTAVSHAENVAHAVTQTHNALKAAYAAHFPELASVNLSALEYAHVVKLLQCKTQASAELETVVAPATAMVISVLLASSKQCKVAPNLDEAQLAEINFDADRIEVLAALRTQLLSFVQRQMTAVAPNLCCVVGAHVAAKLVALAGGLKALSAIPACNVQLLGSVSRAAISEGSLRDGRSVHAGVLQEAPLVQLQPTRSSAMRAVRLLASKCALAARIDAFGEAADGSEGVRLAAEITAKLEQLHAPAVVLAPKPLPAPIEVAPKRRGGRRARRRKELLGATEVQRLQNRVAFGVTPECERLIGDDVEGFGLLGTAAAGRIGISKKSNSALSSALKATAKRNKLFDAMHPAAPSNTSPLLTAASLASTVAAGTATSMKFDSNTGTISLFQASSLLPPASSSKDAAALNAKKRKWFS